VSTFNIVAPSPAVPLNESSSWLRLLRAKSVLSLPPAALVPPLPSPMPSSRIL